MEQGFIFSDAFLQYHFNETHPFNQKRVVLTKTLLECMGLLDEQEFLAPRMATDNELALFHDREYIEKLKQASKGNLTEEEGFAYGIGTEDTPIFPNMHEAAALLVGGTLTAVDEVMEGRKKRVINLGGGLHHGFQNKASGFCIYNDSAVAMRYLRKKYGAKVLYVDTDAHHGDGVQAGFYDDPNVCTFSIHETGRYLFPGTGEISERGIKEGHGFAFNLPIDAFTQDESFLEIYENAFREITDYFKPDIILTQNGADAHCFDPLTHLCGSMKIFEEIPKLAYELANEYCDGRWVATGGGGYDMWRVVPRAWAQIYHVMKTGEAAHGDLPRDWLTMWQNEAPVTLPQTWHDTKEAFPRIPRKQEITEKNKKLLQSLLKYTKKKV